MKRFFIPLSAILFLTTLVSCMHPDPYVRQGRRTGTALGAATGAIIGNNIDGGNSWGGAAIGAAVGRMAGDQRGKTNSMYYRQPVPSSGYYYYR